MKIRLIISRKNATSDQRRSARQQARRSGGARASAPGLRTRPRQADRLRAAAQRGDGKNGPRMANRPVDAARASIFSWCRAIRRGPAPAAGCCPGSPPDESAKDCAMPLDPDGARWTRCPVPQRTDAAKRCGGEAATRAVEAPLAPRSRDRAHRACRRAARRTAVHFHAARGIQRKITSNCSPPSKTPRRSWRCRC